MFFILLFTAILYGILYLLFITITFIFKDYYYFSSNIVSLTYIRIGIGIIIRLATLGTLSN